MKKYPYLSTPSIRVNNYIRTPGNKGEESIYIQKISSTLYKNSIFY